ncbi:MAG TPA: hypothetical protein VF806_05210 [Anaerolineaceae bacterium]
MEILNIGPLELIIILVLMFILLGPKEMILTAQRIGRWVREIVHSPMWREIMGYSMDIRELPKKIMEESGLQETLAEIQQTTKETTDELNAQIREATEAARVPEIEHLRLQTEAEPAVASAAVPAVLQSTTAVEDAPEVAAPEVAAPEANAAAVVEGASEVNVASSEAAAFEEASAPAIDTSTSAPEIQVAPETADGTTPVVEKKSRRRKVVSAAEGTVTPAMENTAVDTAVPAATKRPRARKIRPVEAAGEAAASEAAAGEAAASEAVAGEAPAGADMPAVEMLVPPSETTVVPSDGPVSSNGPVPSNGTARKPRKPRAPKDETPPAETQAGDGPAQIYPQEPSQENNAA